MTVDIDIWHLQQLSISLLIPARVDILTTLVLLCLHPFDFLIDIQTQPGSILLVVQ